MSREFFKKVEIIFQLTYNNFSKTEIGDYLIMNRLKELRLSRKKLYQKDIADYLGIAISTYSNWENNKYEIDNENLFKLAAYYNVSIDYILGGDSKIKQNKEHYEEIEIKEHHLIPLLGSVVAGIPIESQEDIEGYIYIDQRPTSDYFALRVNGQSMKNVIPDKSIIIVRKQETADNGDIIVAMLNGEQTVKRFKRYGDIILLSPENQSFDNIPVTPADDFHILGKVVEARNIF